MVKGRMARRGVLAATGLLVACATMTVLPGVANADQSCYTGCSPTYTAQTGTAPVTGATTVHTGEPWAGSMPEVVGIGLGGGGLIVTGMALRRRRRRAASS